VDIFWLNGDWAMTEKPMVSREFTERFLAPPLRKMVEYAHSRGVPCIKHTDGNVWPIYDIIIDSGIDGLHPIDPMAGMDIGEVYPETVKIITERHGEEKATAYAEYLKKRAKEVTGTEKAANPEEYEGKAKLVIFDEDTVVVNDCTGACKISSGHYERPFTEKYQAALLSAGTGIETSEEMLFKFAKKVRNLERAYCVREGMTRETDSLPKGYLDNPIKEGLFKGSVLDSSKFEKMKDEYYAVRGWDIATGIPTRETLKQTGLGDVARDLEKLGKLPRKVPVGQSKTKER